MRLYQNQESLSGVSILGLPRSYGELVPMPEPAQHNIPTHLLPQLPRWPISILLDNFRSAFNTGSAFRTCDGAGIQELLLLGITPHPPHAKLRKTSLGADQYVPWRHLSTPETLWDHSSYNRVVAIENHPNAITYHQFDWKPGDLCVFGSEAEGVQPSIMEQADTFVQVPVYGYKKTLNVATTLGIVIFDAVRKLKEQGYVPKNIH